MITIGTTTYQVEAAEAGNAYFLTGPRGGVIIMAAYINNENLFHGFRFNGSHADLRNPDGALVNLTKAQLAEAI